VPSNRRDVTSAFRAGDGGLTGLATGRREGRNRLEATAERCERARLDLGSREFTQKTGLRDGRVGRWGLERPGTLLRKAAGWAGNRRATLGRS
jgi:hypothetical protein